MRFSLSFLKKCLKIKTFNLNCPSVPVHCQTIETVLLGHQSIESRASHIPTRIPLSGNPGLGIANPILQCQLRYTGTKKKFLIQVSCNFEINVLYEFMFVLFL
jgi:hypothetical protein